MQPTAPEEMGSRGPPAVGLVRHPRWPTSPPRRPGGGRHHQARARAARLMPCGDIEPLLPAQSMPGAFGVSPPACAGSLAVPRAAHPARDRPMATRRWETSAPRAPRTRIHRLHSRRSTAAPACLVDARRRWVSPPARVRSPAVPRAAHPARARPVVSRRRETCAPVGFADPCNHAHSPSSHEDPEGQLGRAAPLCRPSLPAPSSR